MGYYQAVDRDWTPSDQQMHIESGMVRKPLNDKEKDDIVEDLVDIIKKLGR